MHLFFFLLYPKFVDNLCTPPNESMGSTDEFSFSTTEMGQEQRAREATWKLAKNVFKLKEHGRAAFFSPSENRCPPASTLKPEEREFVVDYGASMHMINKKDLSDTEMDTVTKLCSPIEVQTPMHFTSQFLKVA